MRVKEYGHIKNHTTFCYGCGAILEYEHNDVQFYGSYNEDYIVCMVCGKHIFLNQDECNALYEDLKNDLIGGCRVKLNNGEEYKFVYSSKYYSRTPHFLREDEEEYILLHHYNNKLQMKSGDKELDVVVIYK